MAVETILMHAVSRGGDRQQLHEHLRRHSIEAARQMKEGATEGARVDLLERIAADRAFGLSRTDLDRLADAARYVGRAPEQVARFLDEQVTPVLSSRRKHTPRVAEAALHV
jgi:adenylosuccinate lyase